MLNANANSHALTSTGLFNDLCIGKWAFPLFFPFLPFSSSFSQKYAIFLPTFSGLIHLEILFYFGSGSFLSFVPTYAKPDNLRECFDNVELQEKTLKIVQPLGFTKLYAKQV